MKDKEKDNKTGLLVFRLPESLDDQLVDEFEEKKILDVKSKHQYARKIVTDYLQGRLIYVTPNAAAENSLLTARA